LPERPRGLAKRGHQARMLWRWGAQGIPLLAAKHTTPVFAEVLARAIAEFQPDAVLLEMAQMAQYLPLLGALPTVLTDHEAGVPSNAGTDLGAWADRRDNRLWQRYVREFYPRATLLQAVTDEDARLLGQQVGRPVLTRGAVIDVPSFPVAPQSTPARALFLGDYSHFPNRDAAEQLVRNVLPLLRARVPDVELWLAGPNAQRLNGIGAVPGVRVVGYAPSLPELFSQVRMMLAPIYSGSGFRMKAITALAHGLPVVTNALGARGCTAPPSARQIADDPVTIAGAALRWLQTPKLAGDAGQAAHDWAKQTLAADAVAKAQIERITALVRG
jgi:hypothetical protein